MYIFDLNFFLGLRTREEKPSFRWDNKSTDEEKEKL